MKKDCILNPALIQAIAAIGHTEYFVIADAGLPIPKGVKIIDLSLIKGIPRFNQVLEAVQTELVIEQYYIACEMSEKSAQLYTDTQKALRAYERHEVSHERLKAMLPQAKVVVRTGETTPYANIILVAGVNF
ncbi:MAG: D-ribose pyranase [Ruthenibacterium sp.]